jgi:hypothetical protein
MFGCRNTIARWWLAVGMSLTAVSPALAQVNESNPLKKDKTGISWTLPFKSALAKAKKENRLLLIKPVAFGTSLDGGW